MLAAGFSKSAPVVIVRICFLIGRLADTFAAITVMLFRDIWKRIRALGVRANHIVPLQNFRMKTLEDLVLEI